jgi:glycine dehydrogenase subunit 1
MRYLPKSDEERRQMLAEIGAASIDDLFSSIPAEYRLERDLTVPRQQAESEIVDYFRAAGQKNATDYASFLGAGAYRHYRPVIIDALVQRGEFLTSYTPYQAEITQGTLQAIFEFQTMIAELTGMDVANASMYDGSTGAAEAVMMAVRVTGRSKAVVAATAHPEYREVLATYAKHQGLPTALVGYDNETGRIDLKSLDAAVSAETAAVLVQSPNFFGVIEDIPAIAQIAHAKGALLIVSIAEAVSLGIVRPPVEADIVAMEAQSFGVALSYGGPFCGVIAAKEQFVRQMPGRLAGQTVDGAGNRGFVLTLATRAAHPPRKGDVKHLHQPGPRRVDGHDLSRRLRQGRHPRVGRAQPGKGRLRGKDAWEPAGRKAALQGRPALPRICVANGRGARGMESPAHAKQDRRWHRAESLVSRAASLHALVCDGGRHARTNRRGGQGAGG